ncbi:ThuA domain-containing protein [Croceitalea rosinachiae]|uniref:ThuA domain-containing protein n=1 Tax=Croceitalea rosinachiae TaxID=3075596 RepID=A0ABU3AB28_9FLAO|nr:ThuA domain-containing protein [Croceitalea sp. F388]MDT0606121.1 ThuA domain-containing protein [Croceitalea sp. F388]
MKSTYFHVFYAIILLFSFSCSEMESPPLEEDREEQIDEEGSDEESPARDKSVLIFTKTSGFDHNTKEESVAMVRKIAEELNFEVEVSDSSSIFDNQDGINNFDIVFFTNTSGNTLNALQRTNVEAYAVQGGNFVSNHAASDSYGHSTASTVSGNGKGVWDWYAENVTGCSVRNNPNHTSSGFGATVTIENQNSELTSGISFPWNDNEEWYYWEGGYIAGPFTELLRVSDTGSNSYDDARMTSHYWERSDGGISFYTSMGHSKNKYSDTEFVRLMTNVFDFMLN